MKWTDEVIDPHRTHAVGWPWIMSYELLMVVIGALVMLRPIAAGIATGLFLGVILVTGGVLSLTAGVSNRGWHSRWIDVAVGVLSILLELLAAASLSVGKGWLVFLGLLNIFLGLLLVFSGPVTDLVFLALVIGVSFVVRGCLLFTFAWRLRSHLVP